ncbi:hypothetical protein BDM02DRAFT_3129150 [Thelephora ganbajun]|uniref:Uncharacterized protein n=1 Tax=Thelephora ganbajun TaxID=370292 RepID=A0ACB6ZFC9_THEGA|nr:hypothetical protein BDM02DRAFT_3129150 [Thelephora ganbajun]
MMWKLSLYILYAAGFFTLALADLDPPLPLPLNNCTLTVKSTAEEVSDTQALISYGILNRFAISNPPVNPLTIASGGTSDVFEELGNGLYSVGFGVRSNIYEAWQLRNIVTEQWINTNLFEWDVGNAGNWKILSADC